LCVTAYNKKVLNSVQSWPRSFSALCHYTQFGMASISAPSPQGRGLQEQQHQAQLDCRVRVSAPAPRGRGLQDTAEYGLSSGYIVSAPAPRGRRLQAVSIQGVDFLRQGFQRQCPMGRGLQTELVRVGHVLARKFQRQRPVAGDCKFGNLSDRQIISRFPRQRPEVGDYNTQCADEPMSVLIYTLQRSILFPKRVRRFASEVPILF